MGLRDAIAVFEPDPKIRGDKLATERGRIKSLNEHRLSALRQLVDP
jgi:hypothetical protein